MNLLDMRTVIIGYIISDAICVSVIAVLWFQNRKRFSGIGFWLVDFALQFTALLLNILRGKIPDLVSMTASNTMIIGGTMLLYAGLQEFMGKRGRQIHNIILLGIFVLIHSYFVVVTPSLGVRNIIFSLGLLAVCSQCAWLMLHGAGANMRSFTRGAGIVFSLYCLVSVARIFVDVLAPAEEDFFHSNVFDTSLVMIYQMLFIALTFGLYMMVNRRLAMDLQEDIASREHIEESLKLSEEKFFKAFHSSPDSVTITRVSDGRFMEVNEGFSRATGYSRDEALSSTTAALQLWANPQDREFFIQTLQKEHAVRNAEYDFRAKSGAILNGLLSAEIIQLGNEPHIVSVIHDITERKRTEDALEERTRFTNKLLEATALSTWISDAQGTAIQANPACYRFFGATEAETIGKYNVFQDNIAEQQGAMPLIRRAYETGEPVTFFLNYDFGAVSHVNVKNATHKFIKVMLTPILDPHGKVSHVVSQSIDLTEIKQSEAALRASEERFRQLIISAPDAIFGVNNEGTIMFANTEATHLLGYPPDELIGMEANLLTRSHTGGSISAWGNEPRMFVRHKQGNQIPVEVKVSELKTDEGNLSVAFMRNVTERELVEKRLRQQADLIDMAYAAFIVRDMEGKIQYWNTGSAWLYGWDSKEALGRNIRQLLATQPQDAVEALEERLLAEGHWDGELTHTCKDGRKVVVSSRQALQRDEKGKPVAVLEVNLDITERIQNDAALREAHARVIEQQRRVAAFEERQRIRRDLHDSVNQSIHSLVLFAETLTSVLEKNNVGSARHISERLQESARQALKEMRLLLYQARSMEMETGGDLVQQVELRLATVERRAHIEAQVVQEGSLENCPPAWLDHLFWIIIEALNNSLKYAQARSVKIVIRCSDRQIDLEVVDDGIGFDVNAQHEGGLGLWNMRERARMLGGELTFRSSPGQGAGVIFHAEIK